jgi:hypothetical protein
LVGWFVNLIIVKSNRKLIIIFPSRPNENGVHYRHVNGGSCFTTASDAPPPKRPSNRKERSNRCWQPTIAANVMANGNGGVEELNNNLGNNSNRKSPKSQQQQQNHQQMQNISGGGAVGSRKRKPARESLQFMLQSGSSQNCIGNGQQQLNYHAESPMEQQLQQQVDLKSIIVI